MNNVANDNGWLLPADGCNADPEIEQIMADWPVIAAVAWQEYRSRGRGTVMIDEERAAAYYPGSPCSCHQHLIDTYDPEEQVVVALHDGDVLQSIHVVAGWPAPPDASRITPGARLCLTAH